MTEPASPEKLNEIGDSIDFTSILSDLNGDIDSIDAEDFDPLFPTEKSLSAIDDIIAAITEKIESIDVQTRQIIQCQWELEDKGEKLVSEASELIQSLFTKIREVQERATSSELMVAEITKDIQQLDHAKRNLTVSITTLSNLALIVGDIDHLNATLCINTHAPANRGSSTNPFGADNAPKVLDSAQIEDHLARAQRLMEPMMATYSSVPAVVELNEELKNIFTTINSRLSIEMRELLTSPSARILTDHAPKILTGCRLLDLLPTDSMKMEIINWFITQQLAEYRELYEPSQAIAWLDKIDHRYAWLRTNITPLERKIRTLFPQEWLVLERLIVEFCRNTRKDLEVVMQRRKAEITHNLLVFAMQRTIAFESSLSKIATGATLIEEQKKVEGATMKVEARKEKESSNPFDEDVEAEEKAGKPILETEPQQNVSPFEGIISNCFAPYFDLYLNNIERALNDQLTTRLIGDYTVNKSSLKSRAFEDVFRNANAATSASGGGDLAENTLYSSTDLFLLYKQLLKQTLQLTRGRGLLGLVGLLKKYLREYTEKVLLPGIPGLTSSSSSSGGGLTKPFSLSGLASLGLNQDDSSGGRKDSAAFLATNLSNQFFANLHRDEQRKLPP
ncbi:unnamed protein product [Hymenolepis diminuta]|uniref:Vacuolar protein sorting-associated protein 53 homolog n=1 Tax=Hymenolepis diminuta TaxID=6216 RepID=A0A0R3SHF0_HYMDI|nr:unnamed protein product [Hymenolepis diminuta]